MSSKPQIKVVIFDNDGTLMDTETAYTVAHKECTGYDLDWDFKVQLMGKTAIEACRLTCEHYGLTESPESLAERRSKAVERFWPNIPLMKGAQEMVNELKKRGIKMAIATASSRSQFNLKSSGHKDFVAMMDYVVCGDEVKNGKPAPDLFLAALAKYDGLGIKPEEALVFEDSPLGIKAANVAGMKSVFVPDPHVNIEKSLKENEATPDVIIESLDKFDYDKFEWIKL